MIIMLIEKWEFYRDGELVLTQDRHAKNAVMMDGFYLKASSEMALNGITIERK